MFRCSIILILTLLATVDVTHAQAPPSGSGAIRFTGNVRVIDGDTLEVYINGHQIGIGLIGINAPEGNTDCGMQATGALWSLFTENDITFDEDSEIVFDARRRRMYYVLLPDGSSASVKMAGTGLVKPSGQGREKHEIDTAAATAPKPRCNRGLR